MYCKYCGKRILDNSRYCNYCGANQNGSSIRIKQFVHDHKKISYTYFGWCLIHIGFFLFSRPKGSGRGGYYDLSDGFYPFRESISSMIKYGHVEFSLLDIDVYDFSELFFYTVFLPIIIYGVFLLWKKFFKKMPIDKAKPISELSDYLNVTADSNKASENLTAEVPSYRNKNVGENTLVSTHSKKPHKKKYSIGLYIIVAILVLFASLFAIPKSHLGFIIFINLVAWAIYFGRYLNRKNKEENV